MNIIVRSGYWVSCLSRSSSSQCREVCWLPGSGSGRQVRVERAPPLSSAVLLKVSSQAIHVTPAPELA